MGIMGKVTIYIKTLIAHLMISGRHKIISLEITRENIVYIKEVIVTNNSDNMTDVVRFYY